jgi:hypothetical protein
MREWLDRYGIEPDALLYRMDAEGMLFRLDFRVSSQADAFVEAFGKVTLVTQIEFALRHSREISLPS